MTISTTSNQVAYTGDAVTLDFAFPYPFITTADLKVYVNGTQLLTGFSVVGSVPFGGSGTFASGTVSFLVAPAALATVLIYSDPDQLQSTSLPPNDPFPSKTVEKMVDKLTLLIQAIYRKFGNAITFPPGDLTSGVLPSAANRANKVLAFDASGVPNLSAPVAGTATALALQLADTTIVANGDALVGVKYETPVAAVALNLHNYIEDDGAYNVMGFIDPSLKAAIRNNTSTTDLDTQINAALAAAQADNKPGLRFPRGRFNVNTGVALTMTGNRLTGGFSVRGAGPNQTYIRQTGVPADALFAFQSATPTLSTTTNPFEFSHLTLLGTGKTCNGLLLNSVAEFHVHHIVSDSFTQALDLRSSLVGVIELNHLTSSTNGIRSRLNGTSSYCNAVTVRDNEIKFNTGFAMDLGASNGWRVQNNDIEQNGTAANTATGAIMIRNTCDDEVGFAQIHLLWNWFEQNLGRCIQTESMAGNFFDLILQGGHCVGQESGRVMLINPLRRMCIRDFHAPSAADTVDISADQLMIDNSYIGVVTETTVTYSSYTDVSTVAGDYISGLTGAFTGSLTGCTTVPTASVGWTRQGKTVTLNIPNLTGTSNTTAATITGMPASLWPSSNRSMMGICRNNGVDAISQYVITSAGVITLNNGVAVFTNVGAKGSQTSTLTYEI